MDRRKFIKGAAGLFLPVAPAIIRPEKAWAQLGGLGFPGPGPIHVTGGGGPTTIFSPSGGALNADDSNPGTHFRILCTLSGASTGKIKVTFTASSALGLALTLAYFGKASGVTIGATTTPPVQLLFSGVPAPSTLSAGQSITSDLIDHSAAFSLASGDVIVVNHDDGTPGGQRLRASNTNVNTWFTSSSGSLTPASTQTPDPSDGWFQSTGADFVVAKVETQ